mmetsp:Transcript_133386/g.414791  ORF Transcript_133386/g.414791 Transcript_133386/m.414791 type:complete len:566 (+) Transcript_133386:126-1823(+)
MPGQPSGRRRLTTRQSSMPMVDMGQTSLKLVAKLGLSNFQLLQCMLAVVVSLHAADGAMLPAVFKALEEGLQGATPVSLGVIVLVEALCHSLAVFAWGILADYGCKLCLLQWATLAWGCLTLATAFVNSITSLAVIRALAGIVGAALAPLAQGLIGAVCPPGQRGRAFGALVACGQAGHILGLLMAGSTSHLGAIGGWRGSFAMFALFTIGLSWVLAQVRTEVSAGLFIESQTWQMLAIQGTRSTGSWTHLFMEVGQNVSVILSRRSFIVLIMQGAFACTTVKAMQYQVMWYQYLGFDDLTSSAITSAAPLGCLAGAIASGHLSDWLAARLPNHGRVFMGQAADTVKFIVLILIFVLCGSLDAQSTGSIAVMAILSFLFGFVSIMAYAGVVKPLFVEIVPPQLIAQVIGFAAAVDGAFSSFASTPVVGFITEHLFHYKETRTPIRYMDDSLRMSNAAALGHAIAAVTLTSTTLTVLSFGLLHITYPKERQQCGAEAAWAGSEREGAPAIEDDMASTTPTEEAEALQVRTGPMSSSGSSSSRSSRGARGSDGRGKSVKFKMDYGSV